MIIFLIVSIALFSITIVCIVLYVLNKLGYNYIDLFFYARYWKYLVIGAVCLILSVLCFIRFVHEVQNNAIEHYISGDYELIEKRVDDKVVGSYYRLMDIDYD